jgi:predicted NUDIX family phosphoesterase
MPAAAMQQQEQVLVVNRADFFGGCWPQGFVPWSDGDAAALVAGFERDSFFVPRADAERNPAWKQLIPYCAVERAGRRRELFCARRTRRHSETRLHDLLSIGFGGHVNPGDGGAGPGILARALARELGEELTLPEPCEPLALGLINDDSTEVGQVHAGIAYLVSVAATCEVLVRERSKLVGGFEPVPMPAGFAGPGSLWQDPARFESWSQFLLEALISPPSSTSDQAASQTANEDSGRHRTREVDHGRTQGSQAEPGEGL